jgi:hypothetical protein
MIECLTKKELERIWKEWLLYQYLLGGTEESHGNPVRIAGLRAEI